MPIVLADLLTEQQVILRLRSRKTANAIREIVDVLASDISGRKIGNPEVFLEQLLVREQTHPSIVENGVAFPHDAVDPIGFVFHAGSGSLGFITDLGYVTKLITERLREVQTLVVETNHDEKLLQNDTHRPWPVKQRIQSRHGHLSNAAAAIVIEELLPGKIERVVLGHLSRDCNTPALALNTVRASLEKCGRNDVETYCAAQFEISPRFRIGDTDPGAFQSTFENAFFQNAV